MTELSFYDSSNPSYDACLEYATTFFDGFRNDKFMCSFHPDFFGLNPTTPEPQLSDYFASFSRSWARSTKLKLMRGSDVVFLIKDSGKTAAACLCTLPEYKREPLGWFQWIKATLYGAYVTFADFVDGKRVKRFSTPDFRQFFKSMYSIAAASPDYLAKLAELSDKDLATARYPYTSTLYVNILAATRESQGKGFGSAILKAALRHYEHMEGPTFVAADGTKKKGPAKASLFPTDGNETFYERYGFKTVCTGTAILGDESEFEHKYMQRLLGN